MGQNTNYGSRAIDKNESRSGSRILFQLNAGCRDELKSQIVFENPLAALPAEHDFGLSGGSYSCPPYQLNQNMRNLLS